MKQIITLFLIIMACLFFGSLIGWNTQESEIIVFIVAGYYLLAQIETGENTR